MAAHSLTSNKGDNGTHSNITSQSLRFLRLHNCIQFLKIFTLTRVFKKVWFQRPDTAFA